MFEDVNKQGKQTPPAGAQEPIDIFSEADASAPVAGEIMEEGVRAGGGFPVKIIAIAVGAVVALGAVGAGVYFFVFNRPTPLPAPIEEIAPIEESVIEETPVEEQAAIEEIPSAPETLETQPVPTPSAGVPEGVTGALEADPLVTGEPFPASAQPAIGAPSALSVPPTQVPAPTSVPTVDTDGDGLTDEEERGYGTDPSVVDTDNDGLSDREEVEVYKTSPLNSDTDGDGFSDGTEVKNGYNPNGSGKLITVPSGQ